MTNKDKRASAEELYLTGMKGNTIARLLHVSETSLSAWVKEGNWRTKRAEAESKKKSRLASVQNIIDYMIEALEAEVDSRRREGGKLALLDKGDIDALVKLFSAIKGRELSLASIIDLIRDLLNFLAEKNPELAKGIGPYMDDFLLTKQDQLAG